MKALSLVQSAIFTIFLFWAASAKLFAGGDLDLSFTTGVTMSGSTVQTVAVQTDGRVLVGGFFTMVNGRSFSGLARLNLDGTLDRNFNIGTGFNFPDVRAIAVQTDGKILVGGGFQFINDTSHPYLVRLNADGSLNAAFNVNGAIEVIVLQPNGQILIGGSFSEYNGTAANRIARLNSDGSLDTTFAANLGTGFDTTVKAIALQTNGQIVAAGDFTNVNGTTANHVARLNANGTPDTAFIANTGTGFSNTVLAVAVQTDGRILASGSFVTFNAASANRLARLNTNGTLDATLTAPTSNGNINAMAIQPDGRFFVMGENGTSFGSGADQRHGIARLNAADGSIDTSFDPAAGPNGTNFRAIALQLDGTIVVGGNFTAFDNAERICLANLNADGSLNTNFTTVIGQPGTVEKVLVLPNRKILISGSFSGVNGSFRNGLALLNVNGTVDETFDANQAVDLLSVSALVAAIAVQPDGKIIFGGGGTNNSNVKRVNADGSLDATFNTNVNGALSAIVVQSDGKILIGGVFNSVNGVAGINHIARLNADGTTDAGFNIGTAFDGNSSVEDIVLQSNGQILVGGFFTTFNGTTGVDHIARLNSDGTLDTAFTANTGTGFDSMVTTLALQTDGRILVGGNFSTFNGTGSLRIIRLETSGIRDSSFNVGTGLDVFPNDITLQSDGRILTAGNFRTYNGETRQHLARINTDGSLDALFRSGVAINNAINAVALQTDQQIIIGGALRSYDGIPRFGIARIFAAGGPCRNRFDEDFDGKADFVVYRPSDLTFYTLRTSDDSTFRLNWGINGDRPFLFNSFRFISGVTHPKLDYGIYRPSDGDWHIGNFEGFPAMPTDISYHWGNSTDLPVPGDFDGDCNSDFAVWRPSSGVWYIARPSDPVYFYFGQDGDKPLIGDFDGDGKTDIAVFRPSNSHWYYLQSSVMGGGFTETHYGQSGDMPVPADYDGDGKTDIAVFRPSDGNWYYRQSGAGGQETAMHFGQLGDVPIPADYDGDAVDDIAVYREGVWYLQQSTDGFTAVFWGTTGDIPMPAAPQY